jgi:uncharacterized protein (DUF58 family)
MAPRRPGLRGCVGQKSILPGAGPKEVGGLRETHAVALTVLAFCLLVSSFFGMAVAEGLWGAVFGVTFWAMLLLTFAAAVLWGRLRRGSVAASSPDVRRLERRGNAFVVAGLALPFAVYWIVKHARGDEEGWGPLFAAMATFYGGLPLGLVLVGIGAGYSMAAGRRRRAEARSTPPDGQSS